MQNTNVNQSILPFIGAMSKFGYFEVFNKTKKEKFFSTGIDYDKNMPEFIIFRRQFATPVMPDSRVTGFKMISGSTFICRLSDGEFYIIRGLKQNETPDFDCDIENIDIFKLTNEKYLTLHDTNADKMTATLVLDTKKLGMLSVTQYSQIIKYINRELGGYPQRKQFCRTIYFEVDVARKEIWWGIFNLETDTLVSRQKLFNEYDTNGTLLEVEILRNLIDCAEEKYLLIIQEKGLTNAS